MTTLEFARRYIRFDQSSPITGSFRDDYYPFVRKPFEAADDITCKRLVIYKASSAMGTVCGQIINAKRIVCDVGSQMMVCQTDSDADTWSKTRGKEWLRSIPDAMRLLSRDKYSVTNDLWLFRHKFLAVTGPGINAAQSVQVRYLQTDESHLEAYEPGRLIEFEKRMGGRWDRQALHITTAPDEGKEVDAFYQDGDQNEWHFRCPKCARLVWPLWGKDSENYYNGDNVLFEKDDSVVFVCPHCEAGIFSDTARSRYDLVLNGDYIAQNPGALPETSSFRWSVFAAHWISWRDTLIEDRAAMAAARLGDLKPLEDFTKKRLCKSWRAYLPDFGEGKGANDYKLWDTWDAGGETIKILTSDFQAGKGSEGAHLHALVTQWDRAGNSRRIAYRRVETFAQLEAMQIEFGVESKNVMVDSGFENRLVFRECGKRRWYAFRGSDATEILHTKTIGKDRVIFPMPYSQTEPQSGIVGEKQPDKLRRVHRGRLPEGWAYCIVGANPTLYGYLSALIGGSSGRYFGIAKDMDACYVESMPAFIAVVTKDKRTNLDKVTWLNVRAAHWWDMEVMALVAAIRSGFFPLAKMQPEEKAA